MEQLTIEQFGATVKQKYPQYSKYSDLEIGQKMLSKYPQYSSRIKTEPTKEEATGLKGFGVGVLKGLGSTAKGIGTLLTKAGAGVTAALDPNRTYRDVMAGGYGVDIFNPETEAGKRAEEALTARTTSQKVGKGLEQIAEFFIPASKLAKADKALDLIIQGSKMARPAKAVTRVAGYAGIEGLGAGGVTLAQTGGDLKEAGTAALTAGIAAPVLRGVSNSISKIVDTWPTSYVKKIAPRLNKDAAKLNLTPEETLQRYKFGTLKSNVEREMKNAISQGNKISEILSSAANKDKILNKDIVFGGLKKELPELPLSSSKDISKIYSRLKTSLPNEAGLINKLQNNTITLKEADTLAGKLYSYSKAGDVLTGSNATLANKTAKTIRDFIKTNIKETEPIYKEWSKSIEFVKALTPALKKAGNMQLSGNDLLKIGLAGYLGGVPLALTEGLVSTTRFLPGARMSLQKGISSKITKKIGQTIKPVFEKGIPASIITGKRD